MTNIDKTKGILPNLKPEVYFGTKLQALRGLYRMKQKEIAHKLGISQKAYSRLELSKEPPSQDLVDKIVDIFNKSKTESIKSIENEPISYENHASNQDELSNILLHELKNELNTALRKNINNENLQIEISIKISNKKL